MPLPVLAPVTCRSGPAFPRLCHTRATLVPYLIRSLLPPWPTPCHCIFLPDDRSFSAPPRHQQPTGILQVADTTGPPALFTSMTTRGRQSARGAVLSSNSDGLGKHFSMRLCAPLFTFLCACRARMRVCHLGGDGGHLALLEWPRAGM